MTLQTIQKVIKHHKMTLLIVLPLDKARLKMPNNLMDGKLLYL
jgi:hypothetical protein